MKTRCNICGKSFDARGLHRHMLTHKKQTGDKMTKESKAYRNWKCNICGEIAETKAGINTHITKKHGRSKKTDGQDYCDLYSSTKKAATLKKTYNAELHKKNKQKKTSRKTDKRPVVGPQTRMIEIPVILQVPVVVGQAKLKGDLE